MPLRSKMLFLPVSLLLLAGCASSRFLEEGEVYERHAGNRVSEIRLTQLREWRPVSRNALVIRGRGRQYFLVEPDMPCSGSVHFARTLAIPALERQRSLTVFDDLILDGQRCRVRQMWTLDHEAVQAELQNK